MSDRVEVTCPCCNNRLTVDAASGEVLAEERAKNDPAQSFEDAMSQVRGGAARRSEAFDKAFNRTQKMEDLLEKKFEEAKKKADKDDGKPHNPMDFD